MRRYKMQKALWLKKPKCLRIRVWILLLGAELLQRSGPIFDVVGCDDLTILHGVNVNVHYIEGLARRFHAKEIAGGRSRHFRK